MSYKELHQNKVFFSLWGSIRTLQHSVPESADVLATLTSKNILLQMAAILEGKGRHVVLTERHPKTGSGKGRANG
jgi:hypothetical protein